MDIQAILMVLYCLVCLMQYVELASHVSCSSNEFRHDAKCCALCGPGTAVLSYCNETSQTVCTPCKDGTFSADWTSKKECSPCSNDHCQPTMSLVQICNSTVDNRCGCVGPDQFHHIATDSCRDCKRCSAGKYPVKPCTTETICAPCPENTFSNTTGQAKCIKCTECEAYLRKCNSTQDSVCAVLTTTRKVFVKDISTIFVKDISTTTAAPTTEKIISATINSRSEKKIGPAIIIGVIVCVCLVTVISIIVALKCWRKRKEIYSTVPRSNVIQESRGRSFSFGDLLLRDQPGEIILNLHAMLKPDTLNDWKALAGKLDVPYLQIRNFERDIDTAPKEMLHAWGTSDKATINRLYTALKEIGRDDACAYLEENVEVGSQETIV